VTLFLNNAIVADADESDVGVLKKTISNSINDHRKKAKLWRKSLATSTSCSLNEKLERMSMREDLLDILGEDGLVEGIVVEGTTHEESSRVSEDPVDKEHVEEVVSCCNTWDGEAMIIHEEGGDEKVNVRAVRRDQDERSILGSKLDFFHAHLIDEDALVHVSVELSEEIALCAHDLHVDGADHHTDDVSSSLLGFFLRDAFLFSF
jgi:hypothetical protein